jgi:hypothetical protein
MKRNDNFLCMFWSYVFDITLSVYPHRAGWKIRWINICCLLWPGPGGNAQKGLGNIHSDLYIRNGLSVIVLMNMVGLYTVSLYQGVGLYSEVYGILLSNVSYSVYPSWIILTSPWSSFLSGFIAKVRYFPEEYIL